MKKNTPISIQRILVFLCLFLLNIGFSQKQDTRTLFGKPMNSGNINPNNGYIRCSSIEYEHFLQEKDPKRLKEDQFENWLNPLIAKNKASQSNLKTAETIIKIPVVVHIIYNGEAIGVAPNITDAQVISQITVLNQDFRKMLSTPGFNSNPVGADTEIEFVLAKVDPNGNPTNGIERVNMGQPSWDDLSIESIVKPATIWDPTLYMNMWSIDFTDNSLLGYAQFPDASGLGGLNSSGGTANTDGVVSSYDVFGSNDFGASFLLAAPYNKGRTMTHEIGHFLGLRHIWGDGTGDEDTNNPDCTATDYCADTPQAGWEHYSCGTFDTCPSSPSNDMPENYMDYTNDTCMNIFTLNQKGRINTVMTNSPRRVTLKTSTKGTAIPPFVNDAEVKIETDYNLVNVSDCASLPAPTNKKITLANRGTANLTSSTINYSMNGGANQIHNWTGSLAPNETTIITLTNTASYGILSTSIVTTNGTIDGRISNNSDSESFSPLNYTFTNFVFNLQQDFWGDEITWDLKDSSGTVIYSGGPYPGKHSEVLPLPTLLTQNWTLTNNQCYTYTIYDSQGDGICCGGGNGYYNIKSTDGLTTIATGANYGTIESRQFTTYTLGNKEFGLSEEIYLYPNPTKGIIHLNFPNEYGLPKSMTLTNSLGQTLNQIEVSSEADLKINISTLSNGIYFITVTKEDHSKTLQFIKN